MGKVKESIKHDTDEILFEREVVYSSGKTMNYRFAINGDFSSYRAEISRNGIPTVQINDRTLTFTEKGAAKKIEFEKGVIPSNLMHQYVHELLKRKKQLPPRIAIIYESTGDVFDVDIKKSRIENFFTIEYKVNSLNIIVNETYFPNRDIYCLEAGDLHFIDEQAKAYPMWKTGKYSSKAKRTVHVPPGFSGFSGKKEVKYRLTLPAAASLPGDSRQIIIKEESANNKKKVYYLKISAAAKIKDKGPDRAYDNYLDSFSYPEELKKLGAEVSREAGNPREKINKILSWINSSISRGNVQLIDPYMVFKEKQGECQGISNLFLAMCSGIKLKGRVVIGLIVVKMQDAYPYSFHQWVELWDEGAGAWIPYDPTLGRKGIGLNYIKLFDLKNKVDVLKLTAFLKTIEIEIL